MRDARARKAAPAHGTLGLLAGTLLLLGTGNAAALTGGERPTVSIGVATIFPTSPYRGVDIPGTRTVPFANWEGERFHLRGLQAGYRLNDSRRFEWTAYLRPRFQGYSSGDSDDLDGMSTRHASVDAGLQFNSHLTTRWAVRARASSDILWVHEGQEADLSLTHRWPVNERLTLTPAVGNVWQSANLVDYYYGVEDDETTDDRPAYDGRSASNPYVQLGIHYRFTPRLALFSQVQSSRLDDSIRDSPLVDQSHEVSGLIALVLGFN